MLTLEIKNKPLNVCLREVKGSPRSESSDLVEAVKPG